MTANLVLEMCALASPAFGMCVRALARSPVSELSQDSTQANVNEIPIHHRPFLPSADTKLGYLR